MEDTMNGEQLSLTLISELIQGKELAKQLCNHLISSSSSSSSPDDQSSSTHDETNGFLIEKILSTYEKALTMLNRDSNNVGDTKNTNLMNSNCSSTNVSPRSDVDDMDEEFKHKPAFKKRKTMPRWTEQMKICSKTGLEGSMDDGYSWRKYGQKDILGAKFPRGYYRCTYRNVQGCLATKQVQKSDEDPTVIEVTYRGRHTCIQAKAKHSHKTFPSKTKIPCLGQSQVHKQQTNQPQQLKIEQPPEAIFTFEEVKSEELDTYTKAKEDIFPWYCFLSPSIGSENEDNNILSEAMMENHFMESFSQNEFISPETSESNIFCVSPCYLGSSGLVTSESEITETISAPTSVINSPILDLDSLLGKGDFDTDFPYNTPEYFSS